MKQLPLNRSSPQIPLTFFIMKLLPLPFVFLFIFSTLSAQKEDFFYKKLDCDQGRVMCFDSDGNLWIGTLKAQQPLLLKMSPDGSLLETVRIASGAGRVNLLTDMSFDSEGMIVACGTAEPLTGSDIEASFAFRYNPRTQTMLWSRKVADSYYFANGIVEKGRGGDFLVYGSKLTNTSTITSVVHIDRVTGLADTSLSRNYYVGNSEDIAAGLYHKGNFYTIGKNDQSYLYTITVERYLRQSLIKYDSTGKPVWNLLGSAPLNQQSFLRGRDMLIENDTIVSIVSGDDEQYTKTNAYIFLQKTSLDGQSIWLKKFDIPENLERAQDIVAVPDGYVILCHGTKNNVFYFKTDKNGNFLWGQSIVTGSQPNEYLNKPQSRILSNANAIFMLLNDGAQTVLVKTDHFGNIPDCDRIKPLNVISLPLKLNTMQRNVPFIVEPSQGIALNVSGTIPSPPVINITTACKTNNAEPFDACKPLTFFKELAFTSSARTWLSSTCLNKDGFIYAAGQHDNSPSISKINTDGKAIWSRKLSPESNEATRISQIIADTNGLIVGSGRLGNRLWAFRYSPEKDSMYWSSTFDGALYDGGGVMEKTPGGNFIFYQNHRPDTAIAYADVIELDRVTGKQVVGIARRYQRPDELSIQAMTSQGNELYAIGEAISGSNATERTLIQGISKEFGPVLWAKLGLTDTTGNGRFYGLDIESDASGIIALSVGNSSSNASNAPRSVFLQKMTLSGDVVWAKSYNVDLSEAELARINGAYIIIGKTAPGKMVILKTDLNGNLLIAKELTYSNANIGVYFGKSKNHIIALDKQIIVLHYLSNAGFEKGIFLKMDNNLDIAEGCNLLQPLAVTSSIIVAPKSLGTSVAVPFVPNTKFSTQQAKFNSNKLIIKQLCPTPLPIPDLQLGDNSYAKCPETNKTFTAQSGFVSYLWQDGSTKADFVVKNPGLIWVETTDQCGEKQRDSVNISFLPNPKDTQDIFFYPGTFVKIDGKDYGDEATVTASKPNPVGCDSIITYNLKYIITKLELKCPSNLTVTMPPGAVNTIVNYNSPSTQNECPTSGIVYKLLKGKASGASFAMGVTEVCYQAENRCGTKDTCCFNITVQGLEPACESKTANSCLKFELVSIQFDAINQRRYRFRVTNNCESPMNYTAMQLPNGITAVSPKQNSTYTGNTGLVYEVRNPNNTPFYSIRFKTQVPSAGISLGQYETFDYSLPQQSAPGFIKIMARLEDGTTGEVQFSTNACPVKPWPGNQNRESDQFATAITTANLVYPNPSSGQLWLDLLPWHGEQLQITIFNALGQVVMDKMHVADEAGLNLALPEHLANGLYYLNVRSKQQGLTTTRFVLERG